MHRPIWHISMLFIEVHRIRQCAELPVMTISFAINPQK